jgi:multiple sugar transport system substrate-binding protein
MSKLTRRDFLKTTAGAAAAGSLGVGGTMWSSDALAQSHWKPEKGAKLRVLRWKKFVQGDEDMWLENTKKFTQQTGIEVRPKAAVAANVGSGPDIIISTFEDAHQYPEKLVDVTDVCDYLGKKYGGWYDVCKDYCTDKGRWIAVPMGCAGNALVYRKSQLEKAGLSEFPRDLQGFMNYAKAVKAQGCPPGFALGNATGDGNSWTHWVVWAHGGKMVDQHNNVVIDSPETIAALEYVKELYSTFVPGTLSWLDPNNNKAFLDGQIGLTLNGISIYYAAKKSQDPKLQELAKDIQHANLPIGPVGKPTELNLFFPMMLFKYSKYKNAAKAYLAFMMEQAQYEPWQQAAIGYVTQPLRAYEKNTVWTEDPKHTPYRDAMKIMLPNGYAGTMGYASAATMADFVMVNMVAEAASGQRTPKEAAQRAQKRAERYYKV